MEFNTFKKMANALPKNLDDYRNFSPLVISGNTMVLSSPVTMIEYVSDDINADTKLSVSLEDFRKIQKATASKIEFKEALYIDDVAYSNSEDFIIYDAKDNIFKTAREGNIFTMPHFELEKCKCKCVLFNMYGIHYIDESDNFIASNIMTVCNSSNKYIVVQYKYIKSILNMFKALRITPTIKYGSLRNIIFESPAINVVLMQYKIGISEGILKYKGSDVKTDW